MKINTKHALEVGMSGLKRIKGSVIMTIIRFENANIANMTLSQIEEMSEKWEDLYEHFLQRYKSYQRFINGKYVTPREQKHLEYLMFQWKQWANEAKMRIKA